MTISTSTADGLHEHAETTATASAVLAGVRSSAARDAALRQHGDHFQPILAALRDQPWKDLVTNRDLMDALSAQGIDWSERTVRLYLAEMADLGLIEREGRRGYRLAAAGGEIARELTVARRLGAIYYRMEETVCRLDIDVAAGRGLVSINAYLVPHAAVPALCDEIEAVFRAGLAVGSRVLLVPPGEDILGRAVPPGYLGVGTMCSLTIASLMLRRGIPTQPVFGGLLQVEAHAPRYFLEMIRYDATTLSPNEVFIRANLTSVARAAATGRGAITASFREAPMGSQQVLRQLEHDCAQAGFPGILLIGRPGQAVLNIPVHEGRIGVVLATGLNPLASLWEHGAARSADLQLFDSSRPMVGPAPYEHLIPYQEFRARAVAAVATSAAAGASIPPSITPAPPSQHPPSSQH